MNQGALPSHTGRRPYPGLDPFGFAERDLFFGRDSESRVVSAMIATEPLSILTGASGTGKSSLIRAAVIPNLMSRGWAAVYAHPGEDAIVELQKELLAQAIVDIDRECNFIRDLLAAASDDASAALTMDSRLSEATAWFSALGPDDERRSVVGGDAEQKIPRVSWMAAVVSGCTSEDGLLFAVRELAGLETSFLDDPRLIDFFEARDGVANGRALLVEALIEGAPGLGELARRVWREWLQPVGFDGLVLLLDQAEEIYTATKAARLGPGLQPRSELPSWNPPGDEERIFDREFLKALSGELRDGPLRLCFSLRPEWYTQLRVSLGAHAPDESSAVHILSAMSRDQAERAILQPARRMGIRVDEPAQAAMLDALDLATPGKGIDPFLLGLLTNKAWGFARDAGECGGGVAIGLTHLRKIGQGPPPPGEGRDAAPRGAGSHGTGTDAVEVDDLRLLIRGALEWLVHDALGRFDHSGMYDALDMLDDLFTTGGTRRIVSKADLVNRPLRSGPHLTGVLDDMRRARLVRFIRRRDEELVEIRHERLLEPLLWFRGTLAANDRKEGSSRRGARAMLAAAIDMVLHLDGKRVSQLLADRLKSDALPGWVRESLRHNAESIVWDAPAARTLLCSLLHEGADHDSVAGGDDGIVAARRYRELLAALIVRARPLHVDELRAVSDEAAEQLLLRGQPVTPEPGAPPPVALIRKLELDARMLLLDAVLRADGLGQRFPRKDVRQWTQACLNLPIEGR